MNKKKILLCIIFFITISISLTSFNVRANSPAAISLEYNTTTGVLSVEITHNIGSDDPNTHYIESVEIKVNDVIVNTTIYSSQPTSSTFTYQYNITAEVGDTIQVTAVCNIVGSITRSITVGSPAGGIPGYLGIVLILIISISLLGFIVKKKLKLVKK
jgi:hypothetical protein